MKIFIYVSQPRNSDIFVKPFATYEAALKYFNDSPYFKEYEPDPDDKYDGLIEITDDMKSLGWRLAFFYGESSVKIIETEMEV